MYQAFFVFTLWVLHIEFMAVYYEDFNSIRIYFSENEFDKNCMKKYLNILSM